MLKRSKNLFSSWFKQTSIPSINKYIYIPLIFKLALISLYESVKRNGIKNTFLFGSDRIIRISRDFRERFYGNKPVLDFHEKAKSIADLNQAFNFAIQWKYRSMSIKPLRDKNEFLSFCSYVIEKIKSPQRLIEVGTANGGTLFIFSRLMDAGSIIVSIDIHKFSDSRIELYRNFDREKVIKIIRANTFDEATPIKVYDALGKVQADLLFIDADHTYAGVKNDFNKFSPFVKNGGLIAFHDINPDRGNGVPDFWENIKGDFEHKEFRQKLTGWGGIGVLIKN